MGTVKTSPPLGNGKSVALKVLYRAYEDAADAHADPKLFAVSKGELTLAGAMESDIRWLLSKRMAQQLRELAQDRDGQRQFHVLMGLLLHPDGCFVLSHCGKVYVEQNRLHLSSLPSMQPTAAPEKPPRERIRWDQRRHELWVDNKLAKRFIHAAKTQWSALDAFEGDGWAGPVPISPAGSPNRDPGQRLRELVAELNKGLEASLIRFRKDCEGNRIVFDLP